jgi:hypothetical protein
LVAHGPIALLAGLGYTVTCQMPRHAAQRLLTLLTLAFVLILPLRARAAIVPVCDDDRMTPAPAQGEPSCAVVTSVDDVTGETSAAPICDPRGASAVAPPRILPLTDARIDAVPGCDGDELSPSIGPGSRSPLPAGELASAPQHAMLFPALVVPPASATVVLSPCTPVAGGPLAGVARGVYHPPR